MSETSKLLIQSVFIGTLVGGQGKRFLCSRSLQSPSKTDVRICSKVLIEKRGPFFLLGEEFISLKYHCSCNR